MRTAYSQLNERSVPGSVNVEINGIRDGRGISRRSYVATLRT